MTPLQTTGLTGATAANEEEATRDKATGTYNVNVGEYVAVAEKIATGKDAGENVIYICHCTKQEQ